MNILVDIGHPSDVHFFKHAIAAWQDRGHEVHVTCRRIPVAMRLLDHLGIAYRIVSRKRTGALGLGMELIEHAVRLYPMLRRWKIDAAVSFGGTFTVHAARLAGCRAIVFYDTDTAVIANRITYPFASVIATPDIYPRDLGSKHVRFRGLKECAYLHPETFTPSPGVLSKYGISPDESFSVVRFIAWEASHDIGITPATAAQKQKLVQELAAIGKVLQVPEQKANQGFTINAEAIAPEDYHTLLYHARCCVTEGATTAAEAVLLGTPALYINPILVCYLRELARLELLRVPNSGEEPSDALARMMGGEETKDAFRQRTRDFVASQDNVLDFVVRLVENR